MTIMTAPAGQEASSAMSKSSESIKTIDYKKQKNMDDFLQRLAEFHRHRGVNTPVFQWPTLNGKPIDLTVLYTKVVGMGGWERVCEKDRWDQVAKALDADLFATCTNGSQALKLIYIRYLSAYEKFDTQISVVTSLAQSPYATVSSLLDTYLLTNPPLNSTSSHMGTASSYLMHRIQSEDRMSGMMGGLGGDLDETAALNRRKFSYLLDGAPMTYNYNQHLPEQPQTLLTNPYEKLEIALESGLPNEVDFVFNTVLLLSSDESHQFRVYASRRLVDLMLAHVGFFGVDDRFKLRYLYDNVWTAFRKFDDSGRDEDANLADFLNENDQEAREQHLRKKFKRVPNRSFVKFWHQIVQLPADDSYQQKSSISKLLPTLYNEYLTSLPEQDLLNMHEMDDEYANTQTNADSLNTSINFDPTNTVEFKRIEQLLVVLNNLSFEENNADFMANKCPALYEFLILCLYAKPAYMELRKHSLDILANISRKLKLKLLSDSHRTLLIVSLTQLIVGTMDGEHSANNDGKQQQQQLGLGEKSDTASMVASTISASILGSQDHMDIVRGLEILTKLVAQPVDPFDEEQSNEKCLIKYNYQDDQVNTDSGDRLFIENIIQRLEELLSVQDVLILLHSLECLYQLSMNSQFICNLIVGGESNPNRSNKMISMLVNFLTVDMTYFGMTNPPPAASSTISNVVTLAPNQVATGGTATAIPITSSAARTIINATPIQTAVAGSTTTVNGNGAIKMYKIVSTNNGVPTLVPTTSAGPGTVSLIASGAGSGATASYTSVVQAAQVATPVLVSKQVTNQQPATNVASSSSKVAIFSQDQQAKNALCNWLVSCFQVDPEAEMAKTQLYSYYQQVAKENKWNVLTIPTFFEIFKATFPNLRYDENTNLFHGLRLVSKQVDFSKPIAGSSSISIESNNMTSAVNSIPTPANLSISVTGPAGIVPLLTPPSPRVTAPTTSQQITKVALNQDDDSQSSTGSSYSSAKSSPSGEDEEMSEDDEDMPVEKARSGDGEDVPVKEAQSEYKIDPRPASPIVQHSTEPDENPTEEKTKETDENKPEASTKTQETIDTDKDSVAKNDTKSEETKQSETKPTEAPARVSPTPQPAPSYLCEWNNCNTYFNSVKAVYSHVCKQHLFDNNSDKATQSSPDGMLCLWSGCDQIKRQKWSLVNHIQERHCNETAMKTAQIYRQRGLVPVSNNTNTANNFLFNNPKDAAVYAIQRHQRLRREDFVSIEEGPITKSIRLLSALILRNLAKNSDRAKQFIKPYEAHLTNMAFDLLESSNAIAACLWYLNNP